MSVKLSYSGWQTFKNSGGRAWYLHYIQKLRSDKYKGAFILGDCFDAAAGYMGETRDLEGSIELFKKKFRKYDTYLGKLDTLKSNKIKWSKTEGDPKDWYDTKAEMALRAYYEQVIPHLKEVHSTQAYIKIETDNENNDFIRGYADKIAVWELDEEANKYEDE